MAIFSSIATAIAGALFGGSLLAANIIGAGLAFGAKLALSKLNKPKKQKFTAVQGEVQLGGDVPVNSLFGTGKTKGHRLYYAKWGSGNQNNTDIFALANGWCDGLEPYVYFYGQKYNLVERPLLGGEVKHFGVLGFGDAVSIRFYDGRPGQPVDMHAVNTTAGLGNPWKVTSRLSGICYVVVERNYSGDLFSKGRPDFEWVLRGLREYDPTKDSTVVGGNGPQRLNDPATWVHTKNPAIHRLNYQLGVRGIRSGRTLIGEGKSLGQLDLSSYVVAINYCRTLRKGKPIYECSLFVDGETDHTEALSAFDDAMAGYALNRRGLSGVVVGAPQIPVLTLTDADIPTDRPKPRQPRKSAFELYNHLSGQFTSPEAMWNPESLKPIVVNADVAADKRARQTSIDFLQVSDADIAQYLLNVRYRQNRKGGTKTQPVSRRVGLKVQEGEWIKVDGKDWMISEWRCEQDLRITLVLTETGADIYDDGAIAPGPIVVPPTPPINPSLLSVVLDFNVEAGVIAGASGSQMPCLKFTWTPPADPTITSVNITYEVVGGTQRFSDVSTDPESGQKLTTDNVVSGRVYRAKATITTTPDRFRTETAWKAAIIPTGNMNVLDSSITAAKIAEAAITADKLMNEAVTNIKLANQAVSTAKLQVAAVTEQILANNAVVSSKLADAAVTAAKLADAAITATKFAANIKPVEIVDALPVIGNEEGRQAFFDGKLYKFTGGAWSASVDAVDIAGTITATQIADNSISTPKLAAGSVTTTKISAGAVTANELAANSIVVGKIAAGAVRASELAAGAVIAGKIAAGAVTADTLAIGKGANWLPNSDLVSGITGWAQEYTNAPAGTFEFIFRSADNFAPYPGVLEVRQLNGAQNVEFGVFMDPAGVGADVRNVVGGKWYEFSGYYMGHWCKGIQPYLQFIDGNGTHIGWYNPGVLPASQNSDPGGNLANYQRFFFKIQAPANAARVRPFFRMKGTVAGGTYSYLWVTKLFFGEATANQSAPSDWSPAGVTVVQGGNIVTGAITADKIAANAVTAGKIAAGSVTATEIAAGAVTAVKIAAAAITGDKIAANTIGANHIAAGAITAKQMVITDFENLVANGYWSEGNVILPYWAGSGGTNLHMTAAYSQTGQFAMVLQKTDVNASVYMELQAAYAFAVTGGEQLYGEIAVMSNGAAAPAGLYFRINWYDASKTGYIGYADFIQNAPVNTGFETRSGQVTVPANGRWATLQVFNHNTNTVTQNFIIDRIVVRRMKAGNLIVDGSITANKMNVNSLSAISANLGAVNIEQAIIGNLQVGTSNIQAGAVTQYWINSATDGNQADGVALQLTANHGQNSPPLLVFSSIKAGIRSILKHRLRLSVTGASIGSAGFGGTPMNSSSAIGIPAAQNEDYTNISAVYQPPPGDAATTFDIWVSNLGVPGGQQASWSDRKLVVLQLKR